MRIGTTILSVKDIAESVRFYREVLGLTIEDDSGPYVKISDRLALRSEPLWKDMLGRDDVTYGSNDSEVYFEELDFDGFIDRLRVTEGIRYIQGPETNRWGQRVVKIYDPDMHIIEIGEDIRSVCRRLMERGFNAEQVSERLDVSMLYIRACMAKDTLETERLRLRPWSTADAFELFSLASDPDIGPLTGWLPHPDAAHSRHIIEETLSRPGTFAITEKDSGRLVGSISLMFDSNRVSSDPSDAEIGFWIGKEFWGRGYATEAAGRLLEYGFEDMGCEKVWCLSLEANVRCSRVQEKLGFLFRKNMDIYNTFFGTRSMNVSYLPMDRWRILSGRHPQ